MKQGRSKTPRQNQGDRFSKDGEVGAMDFLFSLGVPTLRSKSRDYAEYRQMRRDPTIAVARAASTAPIKFAEWSVEGDQQDLVDAATAFLEPLWFDLIRQLTYAIDYGWIGMERVWYVDPESGMMHFRLKPLRHENTTVLVHRETGDVLGLRVVGCTEDLDSKHSLIFTHDGEYDNPYGRSRLENIRWSAWHPWKFTASQLARYQTKAAGVVPIIRYPIGVSRTSTGEVSNAHIAKQILESLATSKGVAMPFKLEAWAEEALRQGANPKDLMAWQIDFLSVPSGPGGELIEIARYYDSLKARGYLVPERAVLEGQFGTKAEAETHADVAIATAEEFLRDATTCINTQVIDPFLEANFGEQAKGKAKAKTAPLSAAARAFSQTLLQAVLTNPGNQDMVQGVLDLDAMIDAAGLPRTGSTDPLIVPQLPDSGFDVPQVPEGGDGA